MWILEATTLESHATAPDHATFRLPSGSVKTIGRSTGAEFILDAPMVSRLHCQLSATNDAIQVKDLGSTNGTFVNGNKITSATLHAGDVLKVGRVDLRICKTD
jgi:pSer/pThr/pTyr-binding forkhead associated (FHA) protein